MCIRDRDNGSKEHSLFLLHSNEQGMKTSTMHTTVVGRKDPGSPMKPKIISITFHAPNMVYKGECCCFVVVVVLLLFSFGYVIVLHFLRQNYFFFSPDKPFVISFGY